MERFLTRYGDRIDGIVAAAEQRAEGGEGASLAAVHPELLVEVLDLDYAEDKENIAVLMSLVG